MAEKEASILQLARGAIMERADYEIAKIIDNILDPNTRASAKRKLQLTIEFLPDDNRQTISVAAVAKSTLCPTNPVATALFVSGDNLGEVHAVLEEYTQKVANGEITPKGFFTDFNSDVAAFEEWRDNG